MNRTTLPPTAPIQSLKDASTNEIHQWADRLLTVNSTIYNNPETAFEEWAAAETLASAAEAAGFDVTRGAYGLPTSFEATFGSGDFVVVICAEYDALPDIGHACGHNINATAALGAAIGLAAVTDDLDLRVVLLGTPAEESGGGKAVLLEAGAWEHATISMMVHAASGDHDISCSATSSQGVDRFDVTFTGRAAHASAAPHKALNAAAAVTVSQVAVGLLRQQLAPDVRVNTFVSHGGDATNTIPGLTVVSAEVRARALDAMDDAKHRVLDCFAAGALATGCTWDSKQAEPRYENLIQNPLLAEAWDANIIASGRTLSLTASPGGGSTDMGNVSQVVPSIQPMIAVLGTTGIPHTPKFAEEAGSSAGHRAALDGAIALANTAIDVAGDADSRSTLMESVTRRQKAAADGR